MNKHLESFCQSLEIAGRSEKTIYHYRLIINRFLNEVNTSIIDVGIKDIRSFLVKEKEERENSKSTIITKVNTLRTFFKWLVKEEILDKNPMVKIETPKESKRLPNHLTLKEIERIKEKALDKKLIDRVLVEVLLSSGLRVSEVVNLNWRDIDFSTGKVIVKKGKGDKERFTFLSTKALLLLEKYKKKRKDNSEWVFQSNYKRRMSKETIERHIRILGEMANINKPVTPHRFRHSFTHLLAKKDTPIEVIQDFLGHESPRTTRMYLSVDENNANHHHQKVFS